MPGEDRTGRGAEMGHVRVRGRMGGNRPDAWPVGKFVCTNCGERLSYQGGIPCYSLTCPKCGGRMICE